MTVQLFCELHGEDDDPECASCGYLRAALRVGHVAVTPLNTGGVGRLKVRGGSG